MKNCQVKKKVIQKPKIACVQRQNCDAHPDFQNVQSEPDVQRPAVGFPGPGHPEVGVVGRNAQAVVVGDVVVGGGGRGEGGGGGGGGGIAGKVGDGGCGGGGGGRKDKTG